MLSATKTKTWVEEDENQRKGVIEKKKICLKETLMYVQTIKLLPTTIRPGKTDVGRWQGTGDYREHVSTSDTDIHAQHATISYGNLKEKLGWIK